MTGTQKEKIITITLPTDTYFISGLRDMTLTLVKNLAKVSDQWAFRFQSVVDELCSNAIEYGSAPGENILIRFVIVPEDHLEVIVEDTGGKKHAKAKELQEHLAKALKTDFSNAKSLRGRGLAQIVANWTDKLTFEDCEGGGIRVKASKSLVGITVNRPNVTAANPKAKTGFVSIYE